MTEVLTNERRLAINGLISHWMSEQDPHGLVLETIDYFDVDKIDELIDEAIAPAIADAVQCGLAEKAKESLNASATPLLDELAQLARICDQHAHDINAQYPYHAASLRTGALHARQAIAKAMGAA